MEATVMPSRACVFKFSACDALSRPIAAHMLRWEGSRLVSHGGGSPEKAPTPCETNRDIFCIRCQQDFVRGAEQNEKRVNS